MESLEPPVYSEEIDFQKYWLILKRRWLPAVGVFGLTVAAAAMAALSQEAVYQASGKVQFKSDRTPSLTGLDENLGQVEVLTFQGEPLETQAEIVKSTPIAQEVIDVLNLRDEDGETVDPTALLEGLQVNTVPGTEILQISYESDDSAEAAAIVNQTIESYQNQNIASNREEAAAARKFIEEQLPSTEAEVLAIESRLKQFKEANNVISLENEAIETVTLLSTLAQERSRAEEQLADIEARLVELQEQLGVNMTDAASLGVVNQAAGVQTVLSELQRIQTELELQRARYRSDYPTIEVLERQEARAQALLRTRIEQAIGRQVDIPIGKLQLSALQQEQVAQLAALQIERVGLLNRMAQMQTSANRYGSRADALPQLEKQQREFERQLEAAQTTYETLLTQLQEVRVTENQVVGNVRLVSAATVPELPVGSNSKLLLAAGGFAGILLAIAVAFLLDLIDSSVKTVKEAKELLGYTLLGVIPLVSGSRRTSLLPKLGQNSGQTSEVAAKETFRMLQANLGFLRSDEDLKTVVITSSVPQEGKTNVAANLAATMAEAGRKVLLIDADMRHPCQHHLWNVTNGIGLSHVLAGQAELDDAIETVSNNLSLLSAGVIPPNPVALLDSNRMLELLERFAQSYDFVILDTPPVLGAADAAILGKMADGVLLIVRPGVVDGSSAKAAKQSLMQLNQNVLGMIANAVDPQGEPDSYFYFIRQDEELPGGASSENANLTVAAAKKY